MEEFSECADDIELKLDEADCAAASDIRLTHAEVFSRIEAATGLDHDAEVT